MASFNKVILIGHLTAEPELKQTADGSSVCNFSIGVNRRFAKADQEQQNVDFINIVTRRQQAEFVSRYFKKGNPILICGQIQTRNWTDNQGQKRYATEVLAEEISFVANKTENKAVPAPPNPAKFGEDGYNSGTGELNRQFEEIPLDAELPF